MPLALLFERLRAGRPAKWARAVVKPLAPLIGRKTKTFWQWPRAKYNTASADRSGLPGDSFASQTAGDSSLAHEPMLADLATAVDAPPRRWNSEDLEAPCTTKSSHIVVKGEGDTACIGILPDQELLQYMKDAILENRRIEALTNGIGARISDLIGRKDHLHSEADRVKVEILKYEKNDNAAANQLNMTACQQLLANIKTQHVKVNGRLKDLRCELDQTYRSQRFDLLDLIHNLEEVLVNGKILEPDEPKQIDPNWVAEEDRPLLEAPLLALAGLSKSGTENNHTPEKSNQDNVRDNGAARVVQERIAKFMSPETREIVQRYKTARIRLDYAEAGLENRSQRSEVENEYRQWMAMNDEKRQWMAMDDEYRLWMPMNNEELPDRYTLDMREFSFTRGLTKEIIAAEKNLEEVKAAAIAAGVQLPRSEVSSGFVDDVDDGYKLSFEADWTLLVDLECIDVWLNTAEGTGDEAASNETELDDWDARSIGLSESWSIVADGSNRRRIEKWRTMCEILRSEDVRARG